MLEYDLWLCEESMASGGYKMSEQVLELKGEEELTGLSADTTFITKNTTINGDIEIDGDMELEGRVDGNIRCTGKLVVGGHVKGNIDTGDLYTDSAHIEGEIKSRGMVKIGAGSVTIGDISAGSAFIAGAVKGDLDVKGEVVVDSTAVVVGNIKSKDVQINSGAIVNGMCNQSYAGVDVEKYFSGNIESLD